jgi:hypothetical protein
MNVEQVQRRESLVGLVAVGWLIAIVTALGNSGDPDPRIPAAEMHRERVVAAVSLWAEAEYVMLTVRADVRPGV